MHWQVLKFGDQTVYVVAVEGDMDIAEKKANLWDSFKEVDENDTDAVGSIPDLIRQPPYLMVVDFPQGVDKYSQGREILRAVRTSGNIQIINNHNLLFDAMIMAYLAKGALPPNPLKPSKGKRQLSDEQKRRYREIEAIGEGYHQADGETMIIFCIFADLKRLLVWH